MILGDGYWIQSAGEVLRGFPVAANSKIPRCDTAWLKMQYGEVVKCSGARC